MFGFQVVSVRETVVFFADFRLVKRDVCLAQKFGLVACVGGAFGVSYRDAERVFGTSVRKSVRRDDERFDKRSRLFCGLTRRDKKAYPYGINNYTVVLRKKYVKIVLRDIKRASFILYRVATVPIFCVYRIRFIRLLLFLPDRGFGRRESKKSELLRFCYKFAGEFVTFLC